MGFWPKSRCRRRWFFILAGGFAAGVALLAALRLPAVQVRILRWAAADGDGWRLNVARVSIGLGGGEARGLDFSMPGIVARMEPGVAVRVRPGRFLFGGRELHVERVEAEGMRVVVTPAELETGADAEAEPFAGVLAELRSPLPWVLGAARLGGVIELREKGAELATARLRVEGGGLSATTEGEFTYELEAASRLLPPGPDAVVRSRGTVRVRQNATHGVAAVEVRGDLRLPAYGGLVLPAAEFGFSVTETANGERYTASARFGPEKGAYNATATFAAEFDRKTRRVTGRTDLAAHASMLAWVTSSGARGDFPDVRVLGAGTFSVGVEDGAVSGRFTAGTAARRDYLTVASEDGATARVALNGLPLGWFARRAALPGLRAADARMSGEWMVKREGTSKVFLDTVKPLEIGPVGWDDGLEPALPAASVRVDAAAEATKERVRWELRSLRAGAVAENGPEARIAARGEWSLAAAGGGVVETARVELRAAAEDEEPVATLALGRALPIDATGAPKWAAGRELAKISVRALPLAWLSRWSPETKVAGVWTEAEATVRATDDAGGFALGAARPWRFDGLRLEDAAGAVIFAGEVAATPRAARDGQGRWSGGVEALSVKEAGGRALSGRMAGTWAEADGAYTGEVDLRAELPAGGAAPAAFGALAVELRAKVASVAERVGQIDEFSAVVTNAGGEVAALRSHGAWLYAQRPNGEVIVNSLGLWRLTTTAMPLAWLKDYFPAGFEAEGEIGGTDFLVSAETGRWRLRPTRPLAIKGLSARQDGAQVARAVNLSFYPGVDLTAPHALKPTFQLAWEASVHATDGLVETSGGRALEFEAAAGVLGNLDLVLPKSADLVARGDLAAARAGFPVAMAGLPVAGKITLRIDGAMSGPESVEAWVRVENVPAAEGDRMLEPVELSARGKVNGTTRKATFDVALRMGEGEAAGDLAFGVTMALEEGTLRLDSALRGKRWDVAESLAWARAAGGAAELEEPVAAEATPTEGAVAASPLGSAFWGPLRGRFELDIGELRMAPYRVDGLRGRVDIEERELVVSELGGEMFAGRLGGGFRVDYEPGAEGGDHALSGALRIEQFDTARVVQTVFENDYGSLDATVDLRAAVRGRGFLLFDLVERAEVDFSVNGKGVARLTHPDARTASTLLVMGGVLTLSPELRALGRLLKKFAEMPLDELSIEGGRAADGSLNLSRVRLDSPQMRLEGSGVIAVAEGVPLPARDLSLTLGLSARDEMGVILGRMRLLEKREDADGFRRLNQAVAVKGQAGRPDPSELYDLFARGVAGSRGTWGFIMRKVQRELEKQQAAAAKAAAKEAKS